MILQKIANQTNFSITHRCTLKEAMSKMRLNGDGSVVLLKNQLPIAILTESDIINTLGEQINLTIPALNIASTSLITANEKRPIEYAFHLLSQHNIKRIVLINRHQHFVGVVLQENLFDYMEEDIYKVDLQIAHIVKSNQHLITIKKEASLYKALNLMKHEHIGSVIVEHNTQAIGILTEKDILKLVYLEVNIQEKIENYMSIPLISVEMETLVTEVIKLMREKNIRRILVTNQAQKPIAILTNRDILKHIKGNYSRILQIKIKHAQEIMDFLPEAIVEIFDGANEQIIYWMNQKAKNSFGEHFMDNPVTALFLEEDWYNIYTHFKTSSSLINKRVQINQRDFEISGTLSKNLNNQYIKLILKDVTEHERTKRKLQKEIEKQIEKRLENEYLLMQQSKLATMGEMIGHIAHQWRQPLAQLGGVFMNLEATYEFNELSPEYFNKKVKHGNELIKYMSNTIEDFRNFFIPNRNRELFDVAKYIQSAINIIHATLTYHHITLEIIAPKEPIFISGYPSEFSQVILNLLDNAKDILVERDINTPKIVITIQQKPNHLQISIKDNGGGIDKTIIDKIFDIYFSTKIQKGGSGLGLYMSKLIVESKLMGKISAYNGVEGAVICIEI